MLIECPGCGEEVEHLVRHHWYDSGGHLKVKLICNVCNRVLGPRELYGDWEEQKKFLDALYAKTPREVVETLVLEVLREHGEFDKRVGTYLRERSTEKVRLRRYIRSIRTRVSYKLWHSDFSGLTLEEKLSLEQLRKHPRKNKEIIRTLLNKAVQNMWVEEERKVTFLMRRFFGFDNDSPTASEFELFCFRRERASLTHREMYRQDKKVRDYVSSHPEIVTQVAEKYGVKETQHAN